MQFQAGENRLPIVTRPQALRRVLTNLLDNALKFGDYATISIDDSAAGEVVIHIMDGGPGIPDAELEAVLQPFYRVETSRNRDTGGTGLGGDRSAAHRSAGRKAKAGEPRRGRAGRFDYSPAPLIVRFCISAWPIQSQTKPTLLHIS